MNNKGFIKIWTIIMIVVLCGAAYMFNDQIASYINQLVTTEENISNKITVHTKNIISGDKKLSDNIIIKEVQYSKNGKVAILVVENKGDLNKKTIYNSFKILKDMEAVDEVKIIMQ